MKKQMTAVYADGHAHEHPATHEEGGKEQPDTKPTSLQLLMLLPVPPRAWLNVGLVVARLRGCIVAWLRGCVVVLCVRPCAPACVRACVREYGTTTTTHGGTTTTTTTTATTTTTTTNHQPPPW
jgi:hypothetical protein